MLLRRRSDLHTNSALRKRFCQLTGLLLLFLLLWGCARPAQQPSESATTSTPESSAVESLFHSSADYQRWFCFYVWHSGYVSPDDADVYREIRRLGFINIEADTPEYKHRAAPGAYMVVSLTDRGSAMPGLVTVHDGWGVPLAQQQIVSITPAGQGPPPERLYRYNVVYKWELNQVGSEIEGLLPVKSKPPGGLFQVEAYIKRGTSGMILIGHPSRGVPVQQ
jgi:hypothetical protein